MRILISIIAFFSALVAVWFMVFMPDLDSGDIPGETETTEAEEVPKTQVLVIARDIERGAPITEEDIEWRDWPAELVSEGSLTRSENEDVFDQVVGLTPRNALAAGDPVRLSWLADKEDNLASLEYDLPSGARAISVPIDPITQAGGFVLPGSFVDVMYVDASGAGGSVTRIIAGNTRVIALDQRRDVGEDQATSLGRIATLEVSIEQAQRISSAERDGKIVLALRSISDRNELTRNYEDRESIKVKMIMGGEQNTLVLD